MIAWGWLLLAFSFGVVIGYVYHLVIFLTTIPKEIKDEILEQDETKG